MTFVICFLQLTSIFFLAELTILNFLETLSYFVLVFFQFVKSQKYLQKNVFFLEKNRIDKIIKLSDYIKNLLLENVTISFIHL